MLLLAAGLADGYLIDALGQSSRSEVDFGPLRVRCYPQGLNTKKPRTQSAGLFDVLAPEGALDVVGQPCCNA